MKIRLPKSFIAIAAACGFMSSPALAEPKDADPALWVMRDADTTIYLFGTVHLLPKGLVWFDEAIADAFNASDELKLELLPIDNPASLGPLVMKYAMDPNGRTMSQRLSKEDHTSYVKALTEIGLPADQLESLEPWFIGLQAVSLMYVKAGYDPSLGGEQILTQAARNAGKTITAFETPEQQFAMLDATPETEQLVGVRNLASRREEGLSLISKMIEQWARGDSEETGRLINEEMKQTPETARVLLTERNVRWAAELKDRLASPGVVFVAVGAGHLTGENSVQNLLSKKGLKVDRVAY
jgi:uncharacterized protein YbaP (TraB family)